VSDDTPIPTDANSQLDSIESMLERLDHLDEAALDALPYGLIKLDRQGTVLAYNRTEADLARIDQKQPLGRNFFTEVAPCTRVQAFHGRFLKGLERGELNERFGFQFKFPHGPRYVAINLYSVPQSDSVWVIVATARPG